MKYVKGDLLDLTEQGMFDVAVQGCNCFCTMGSGIARSIRNRWPEAYNADLRTPRGARFKLGVYSKAFLERNSHTFIVINAYTQYDYRFHDGVAPVDYNAIRSVFKKLAKDFPGKALRFGIPKIGAGLAGGDWDIIEKIIDEEMEGRDITCVLFE